MAVVVVRSLDGLSIDDAAVKLFELWGIGKKTEDNGLLVLHESEDRPAETGHSLFESRRRQASVPLPAYGPEAVQSVIVESAASSGMLLQWLRDSGIRTSAALL